MKLFPADFSTLANCRSGWDSNILGSVRFFYSCAAVSWQSLTERAEKRGVSRRWCFSLLSACYHVIKSYFARDDFHAEYFCRILFVALRISALRPSSDVLKDLDGKRERLGFIQVLSLYLVYSHVQDFGGVRGMQRRGVYEAATLVRDWLVPACGPPVSSTCLLPYSRAVPYMHSSFCVNPASWEGILQPTWSHHWS